MITDRATAGGLAVVTVSVAIVLAAAVAIVPWDALPGGVSLLLVLLLLVCTPFLVNRWPLALLVLLAWLVIEDLLRKLAGNDIRLYFIKDLVYVVLLIAVFRSAEWRGAWQTATGRARYALYALVLWALMMSVPAALVDWRMPAVGLRLDFLYAPLVVVGFLVARDATVLGRVLVAACLIAGVACVLGAVQAFVGPNFLAPWVDTPGLIDLNLIRGALLGSPVYRPTGTFVDPGRFGAYAVSALALGLAALFLMRGHKRGVLVAVTVIAAVAVWVSGGRSGLIAGGLLVGVATIGGAMTSRQRPRPNWRLVAGLAVIASLAAVAFPKQILNPVKLYWDTLNPFSAQNEWLFRVRSYGTDTYRGILEGGLAGLGMGHESLGKQYLFGGPQRIIAGLYSVEGGYAAIAVELGVIGLILWLVFTIAWTIRLWRQVWTMRAAHDRAGTLVLFGWLAFFLFPAFFSGLQTFQNYTANAYFWLFSGLIFGLARSVRGLSAPWAVAIDQTSTTGHENEYRRRRRALTPVELAETPRVLVLAPDPAGLGGVQQVTRTLLNSLTDLYGRKRVGLLQLWDHGGQAPPYQILYMGVGTRGKPAGHVSLPTRVRYQWAAAKYATLWKDDLLVVAAHAHLAPVAWVAAKLTRRPYVVWCHGLEVWGPMSFAMSLAIRHAAAVFTSNRFTAARVEQLVGLPSGTVDVFPYGLPPGYKSGAPARTPHPTVLAVARLAPADAYKGIDTLICAWPQVAARVPEARLEIIGDGSDRPRLMKIADTLSLDGNIRFAGRVSDEELQRAYARATVFALPGRHSFGPPAQGEGFGMVFVEAGAAGLPVVAGRAAGALAAVEDEENGLLVDPNDPGEVANAIVRLLMDPELAERLGRGGQRRAEGMFSYGVFKANVDILVRSVARAGKSHILVTAK